MRAGAGCSVHHRLSPDAAMAVQQALILARRRGHSQVTPLHVALTLLTSENLNLLRKACKKSQSHSVSQSFQLRTLEFCFNVALNRLPTITTACHDHLTLQQRPSLSNALVAVFKRAQANQRRGGAAAGNSATCFEHGSNQHSIKVELEQLILSILDDPSVSRVMREAGFSSPQLKQYVEENTVHPQKLINPNQPICRPVIPSETLSRTHDTDVSAVMEGLVGSKGWRNTVVVGECLATAENVVKETMKRLNTSRVPEALRNVEFINPQLSVSWFRGADRSQMEERLLDLNKAMMRSAWDGRGAILYLGDLRWALEGVLDKDGACYCPVRHVIEELGRMVCCHAESRRVWGLATATYQTYLHLRNTQSGATYLDVLCGFHPVIVPAGSLTLSLSLDIPTPWDTDEKKPQCLLAGENPPAFPLLDSISKRAKPENWNTKCCTLHGTKPWMISSSKLTEEDPSEAATATPILALTHQPRTSNINVFPEDCSSFLDLKLVSGGQEANYERMDAETFKRLCKSLEEITPPATWEMIHRISSTILMCRSGMKINRNRSTWLLFLGPDEATKSLLIKSLAQVLFGSQDMVFNVSPRDSFVEDLMRATRSNRRSVFVLDHDCKSSWTAQAAQLSETGKILGCENADEDLSLSDAVVVITSFEVCNGNENEERKHHGRWKRKGDWGCEEAGGNGNNKKKQMNNNCDLDLNICVESKDESSEVSSCSVMSLKELVDLTVVFK